MPALREEAQSAFRKGVQAPESGKPAFPSLLQRLPVGWKTLLLHKLAPSTLCTQPGAVPVLFLCSSGLGGRSEFHQAGGGTEVVVGPLLRVSKSCPEGSATSL